MPNIFLSHSSADKERYVRIVAQQLQKHMDEHSIHYDEFTFEAGMKSMEEIASGLNETDLFVIFLSKRALESDWVKKELLISKELLGKEIIKRIYPIVIEPDLDWDNIAIPNWLKEYTLKYISRPTKATQLIRKRVVEITWDSNPKIEARKNIFVGRNQQIEMFEERKYDYDKDTVLAYIAAGIPKIGRSSLLRNCFIKAHIIKTEYCASKIELGMYDGIEDFILWVNDLGYSDNVDLTDFMQKSLDEKCRLLARLLDDVSRNKELLMIEDKGCIITHDGTMRSWFLDVLQMMEETNRTVVGIASKFRISLPIRNDKIYVINVPPLNKIECGGLLQKYLEIDGITLKKEDFKNYVGMMKGFPQQIQYACSIIEKYGPKMAYDFSTYIENYDTEIVMQIIREFETSKEDMEFLRFLSEIDMISYQALQQIVEDDQLVKEKINKLYINGIIEFVGVANEYIKINVSIKDYLTRAEYKLSDLYSEKLQKYVTQFLSEYKYEELDMPNYLLKLKESLAHKGKIDNRYMIPSQYLKTMVELYEKEKDYLRVIEYADIVLRSTDYIEEKLLFEIRYFLCLALAKRRDRRMLTEVQHIQGADHNFLLGFYYRMTGHYEKALEKLDESLCERKNFSKAKREKVQVLINLELFEEALSVAKENYESDKSNLYHIHAYFLCLIKSDSANDSKSVINEMLVTLEKSTSDFGKELFLRCKALKAAYEERDLDMALALIDKASESSSNPIYALQDEYSSAAKPPVRCGGSHLSGLTEPLVLHCHAWV